VDVVRSRSHGSGGGDTCSCGRAAAGCLEAIRLPQVEQAVWGPIGDLLDHLAALDVPRGGSGRADLADAQLTRLSTSARLSERQNTLAVKLAILLDLDAVPVPCAQEVAPCVQQARDARPAPGVGPVGPNTLDLRMRPLDRAVAPRLQPA
jgi:hypothetical protein